MTGWKAVVREVDHGGYGRKGRRMGGRRGWGGAREIEVGGWNDFFLCPVH